MRAATLALVLALVGCAPKKPDAVESFLPEAVAQVEAVPPRQILEEGAEQLDPTPRAAALGWLIALSEEPGSEPWGPRTLYDPSAWVQRAGVDALASHLEQPAARSALEDYVALGQADPYARATAGIQLASVGSEPAAKALSEAWRAEREPWLVAPLALAAAAHGDEEALAACSDALASGEIGLELSFLEEVGRSAHPELQEGLKEGSQWIEEELALPYAAARVQLGDPSGEQEFRKALQDADATVRLGAIDLLLRLDHPTATALLQKARNDNTTLVRWYARLALAARSGDFDLFEKAFAEPDVEVRQLAVRLAARASSDPAAGANRKQLKAAERVVLAGLADPDSAVRLEAVRGAARLDLRGSSEVVAGLTRDPWILLRIEAAGAALALGWSGS